jgi:hypothetical protein
MKDHKSGPWQKEGSTPANDKKAGTTGTPGQRKEHEGKGGCGGCPATGNNKHTHGETYDKSGKKPSKI